MHSSALLFVALCVIACKKEEVVAVKPAEVITKIEPRPRTTAPSAQKFVAMDVTEEGFVPENITAKVGETLTLAITRKTEETCAKSILVEGTDIHKELPFNTTVEVTWVPTKAGKVKFGCDMDMMIGGVLLVE